MGLLSAISNAVSGLSANQQNLNILSQNISNANTPNYSNEIVNQTASYASDGEAQGVSVTSITRTVDDFLNAQVQTQTSANSSASTVQNYYSQIESLLGQPGTSNSIDQGISAFFAAVQSAANTPSSSAQTTVVNAAESSASQISSLASSLYGLQSQADGEINNSISSINADIQSLQGINLSLERASATNQSIAGLEDQRDAAVNDIAQYIGVSPSYALDGQVTLNTSNGITLVSPTTSSKLTYTPAVGTQTFISNANLSPIQVQAIDANGYNAGAPVTIATRGPASGVTTSITSGKLQGLLNVRDTVIPNILSQLDQLAGNMRDQVNAITNAGTSSPPPNSYTGSRLISGSSTSQYSGSVQIAVLDSNGNPIASPYADEPNGVPPLDLNLGTMNNGNGAGVSSVDNIINAINQYYGTPQNKLELGNLNNVQLALASNTVNASSSGTVNFGFNLNNISGSSANFYVTGAQIYVGGTTHSAGTISGTGYPSSDPSSDPTATAYATVPTGQTVNTATDANGPLTAALNTTDSQVTGASYFTVVATIATVNASGNVVNSTVTYNIPNNTSGVQGNLIGASGQTSGDGTIVAPTTSQPLAVASLVDANGNPLTETNGSYGNQQGYLKIAAGSSTETIAINELNSKQLGIYTGNGSYQPGTNQGFSQYLGLNNFFTVNSLTATGDTTRNSALNLSVASQIQANPSLVSTGVLAPGNAPANASSPPNYTYQLSSGDNSISQKLAALASGTISFNSAGGLPTASTTFSQYAGQIIANTSTNSTNATSAATDAQTILTGFTNRASAVSGVNLDQELANTVIYQNAYTASTRVITVVSDLFTQLMGIIQ